METVKIIFGDKVCELPVVVGTEGEKGIDISKLRQTTGLITLDPGFANTGSCNSAITFMDGEKGILRYRGIPVEDLAEHSIFTETAYLLINGKLPTSQELNQFSVLLNDNSLIHEDMQFFFQNFPRASHPMGIMSAMVTALRSFYPELKINEEEINLTVTRLLSKVRTLAAMSYKISRGHKVIYPRPDLNYPANFLNMMFDNPVMPYHIDNTLVQALNVFWILHADHEQNCSTSTVRMVGSGRVNLYAAITDDYFIEHHLYPNIVFYSGIVLRAMGIPTNMFTVMFAIGRLPGWIAQWKESLDDPNYRLSRPRNLGQRGFPARPAADRHKILPA